MVTSASKYRPGPTCYARAADWWRVDRASRVVAVLGEMAAACNGEQSLISVP
jgi:hypothetical protein